MKITTIGIDLAKSVFSFHGVDEHGKCVLKKQVRRQQLQASITVHGLIPVSWHRHI
jgi:hypothetical protein